MQQQVTEVGIDQFATIAVNLLHQGVLEAGRTTAKRIFRELEEGRRVSLTKLKMEDGGQVRIDLTLDRDAFNGAINYSAFRDGVLALVARLSDELRAGKSPAVYYPLQEQKDLPDAMAETKMFGAGGVTIHDGTVNVLLLGVAPDPARPIVTLQLAYVDPLQFSASEESSS